MSTSLDLSAPCTDQTCLKLGLWVGGRYSHDWNCPVLRAREQARIAELDKEAGLYIGAGGPFFYKPSMADISVSMRQMMGIQIFKFGPCRRATKEEEAAYKLLQKAQAEIIMSRPAQEETK